MRVLFLVDSGLTTLWPPRFSRATRSAATCTEGGRRSTALWLVKSAHCAAVRMRLSVRAVAAARSSRRCCLPSAFSSLNAVLASTAPLAWRTARYATACVLLRSRASANVGKAGVDRPDGSGHLDDGCVSWSRWWTARRVELAVRPGYLRDSTMHARAASNNHARTYCQPRISAAAGRARDDHGEDKVAARTALGDRRRHVSTSIRSSDCIFALHCPACHLL